MTTQIMHEMLISKLILENFQLLKLRYINIIIKILKLNVNLSTKIDVWISKLRYNGQKFLTIFFENGK